MNLTSYEPRYWWRQNGPLAGWYDENIPIADALYDNYLEEIRREGELL